MILIREVPTTGHKWPYMAGGFGTAGDASHTQISAKPRRVAQTRRAQVRHGKGH